MLSCPCPKGSSGTTSSSGNSINLRCQHPALEAVSRQAPELFRQCIVEGLKFMLLIHTNTTCVRFLMFFDVFLYQSLVLRLQRSTESWRLWPALWHCGTAKPKQEQCGPRGRWSMRFPPRCSQEIGWNRMKSAIQEWHGMTVSTLHPFALRLASSKCVESTLTAEKPIIVII